MATYEIVNGVEVFRTESEHSKSCSNGPFTCAFDSGEWYGKNCHDACGFKSNDVTTVIFLERNQELEYFSWRLTRQ